MSDTERLRRALGRLAPSSFAVLDGGLWDDLPGEFKRAGLSARSLFLGAGLETERAGPWLVPLGQRDGDEASVLSLGGEAAAGGQRGERPQSMMITEAAREAIDDELGQLNQEHWLQLESQVHYHGKEGNF